MRIRCTACSALLQVSDQVAGKRIRCPKCKEATVAVPLPVEKPRPKTTAVQSKPPVRAPKIAVAERDEDAPRPRKKKKKRKKANSQWIVGLSVTGGVAVCIALTIVVFVLTKRPTPVDSKEAQAKAVVSDEPRVPPKQQAPNPTPKKNAAPTPPESPSTVAAKPTSDPKSKNNPKPAPAPVDLGRAVNVPFDETDKKPKRRNEDAAPLVPVVESNFKLPDITEAEWLALGDEELKGIRRTLVESYDKVGHKDPKWDEPARKALEFAAQMYVTRSAKSANHHDIYPQVVKAIAAGCDDPLILYLHARTYSNVEKLSSEEVVSRLDKAAQAMRGSKHSPYRRMYTFIFAALANLEVGGAERVEKARAHYADALDAFAHSVKEENDNVALQLHFSVVMVDLRNIGTRLTNSSLAGYQAVDAALKKAPNREAFRLKLLGAFMTSYAWEARGAGVAATVGQDRFKLFNDRLLAARQALAKAWELDPTDAMTAAEMITVLKGLGADADDIQVWFDRAMKADPGCEDACNALMDFLDPKWGGNAPDLLAFGRECAKSKLVRTGIPLLVAEAHFRLVVPLDKEGQLAYLQQRRMWKEIHTVFDAHFKALPTDGRSHTLFAIYCAFEGQKALARQHFEQSSGELRSMVFGPQHLRWAREVAGLKKE